jgi:hypothetical protein
MQKFQFFTASPLKMRACGTGRKFAEYDQRDAFSDQLSFVLHQFITSSCMTKPGLG